MSKKWTNQKLPGALQYVTGNVDKRRQIFRTGSNCIAFLEELQVLKNKRASKVICFAVMPDHFHLIVNPRDGDIQTWIGELKSLSAKNLVQANPEGYKVGRRESGMARELQKSRSLERMDDLAKDQLYSSKSTQSQSRKVVDRLSMVEFQILLRARV